VTVTTTHVRDARPEDLPAICAIYARAAERTPATFDFAGPTLAWWEEVLADPDHDLLVAVDGEDVLGYARTSQHKIKPAYATTCETSVYVAETARGRGVGHALYTELLARLEAGGVRLLAVAGVTLPNEASERLHRAHGFTEVGTFHAVGVKYGREWDVKWFERRLRR
jgi:phosphinothricin acetyltransferase